MGTELLMTRAAAFVGVLIALSVCFDGKRMKVAKVQKGDGVRVIQNTLSGDELVKKANDLRKEFMCEWGSLACHTPSDPGPEHLYEEALCNALIGMANILATKAKIAQDADGPKHLYQEELDRIEFYNGMTLKKQNRIDIQGLSVMTEEAEKAKSANMVDIQGLSVMPEEAEKAESANAVDIQGLPVMTKEAEKAKSANKVDIQGLSVMPELAAVQKFIASTKEPLKALHGWAKTPVIEEEAARTMSLEAAIDRAKIMMGFYQFFSEEEDEALYTFAPIMQALLPVDHIAVPPKLDRSTLVSIDWINLGKKIGELAKELKYMME